MRKYPNLDGLAVGLRGFFSGLQEPQCRALLDRLAVTHRLALCEHFD